MNYSVYKLRFLTPVHFGTESALSLENVKPFFCADTLFSALCHMAKGRGGDAAVQQLCEAACAGELVLSDSMPWRQEGEETAYYLPRMFMPPRHRADIPPEKRKAVKNAAFIPAASYGAFLRSMAGEDYLDVTGFSQHFGSSYARVRVSIQEEETTPYYMGLYDFEPGCGLWVVAGWHTEAQRGLLDDLLTLLGYSGIGGKVSSGCGKFRVEESILLAEARDAQLQWLYRALCDTAAPLAMTLASCLPAEDELDAAMESTAGYQLIRRSGFVGDVSGSDSPVKKQTQYGFKAGSVFGSRFAGQVSQVGCASGHPVYRLNRPLWMGVEL